MSAKLIWQRAVNGRRSATVLSSEADLQQLVVIECGRREASPLSVRAALAVRRTVDANDRSVGAAAALRWVRRRTSDGGRCIETRRRLQPRTDASFSALYFPVRPNGLSECIQTFSTDNGGEVRKRHL